MDFLVSTVVFLLFIAGVILYLIALADAAKREKWNWFILLLVIWPLFIYYLLKIYNKTDK